MSPERTHQARLDRSPTQRRVNKKAQWGNFDKTAGQIRRVLTKNPLLAPLLAAGMGAAALGNSKPAKADELIVGRNPGGSTGNVWFDVLNDETGTLTSYNQGFPGTITGMLYVSEGEYTLFSANGWGTLADSIRRRDNGSGSFTTLPITVSTAKEFDYNPDEGTWSVASQVGSAAVLGEIADPTITQTYNLPGKLPHWVAFQQNSPTPFALAINGPNTVSIHNIGGDLNGDGFPDNTTPPQIASIDLGSGANPQAAWYDRVNKVLYVACKDTQQIRIYNIDDTSEQTLADTANQTPVIIPLSYKPTDLKPSPDGTKVVVTGNTAGGYPYSTVVSIGTNASDASVTISDTSLAVLYGVDPLPDYQSIAFDSAGGLWLFSMQGGTGGAGYATEFDLNLIPTGETRTFGDNQVNVGGIALSSSPPTDPLNTDDDGDGLTENQGDCNDADPSVWAESEFWVDADGDLVGDDYTPNDWFCGSAEAAASGYTAITPGDCDDTNATTYPGAPELCDGIANDCNYPSIPADELDSDGDGLAQCEGDCDDGNGTVFPGAPEQCNGVSDDCDIEVDEDLTPIQSSLDGDEDGFGTNEPSAIVESCAIPIDNSTVMTDCDDGDAAINPGASEICGGGDEDCDGQENEGDAQDAVLLWTDEDGDGRGLPGAAELGCEGAPGTATQDGDCDDSDALIYPGAPEYADGRDKDCDTHPSAALNTEITATTDDTLIGNPGIPAANGPNYINGLGESENVQFTQMARVYDEILDETQEFLGYQVVNPAADGTLTISREAGGLPVYVHQRPDSAPEDYIPTWTAAVTGTVLEVLDQPNGTTRLTVTEGTSVEIESEFYDAELWAAYFEENPEASENPTLSGPGQWAEVDEATGEIVATNVQEIQDFLNFAEEYQQGDDDSGDDDSGDDDTGDDDATPDDDDATPDDDDATGDDDTNTPGDDDSAGEIPDCEGCDTSGNSENRHPFESIFVMLGLAGAALRRRFRPKSLSHLEGPAMIEELSNRVGLLSRVANKDPDGARRNFRSDLAHAVQGGDRSAIKARRLAARRG